MYVHVPWCASRCGYCDFNTYVPGLIAGTGPQTFADDAITEIRLARQILGDDAPVVSTVFFGGGTPTMLEARELVRILDAIDAEFGLAPDAEVTTEANPESVDARYFTTLRTGGFNRISLGMQSAVSSVLRILERQHSPGRAVAAAQEAFGAGFDQVSLDLIYGTPGESDDDWQRSLDTALSSNPTHVSAYSLIVEDGTAMGRKVARGDLPAPQEDVLAKRYEMADAAMLASGLQWYEVSNWARRSSSGGAPDIRLDSESSATVSPDFDARCRHNMLYWRSDNWWGIGPGAHSHVGGVRWWNVKHPATYAKLLSEGRQPVNDYELLSVGDRQVEDVMLRLRLREGVALESISVQLRPKAAELAEQGILDRRRLESDQLVLTDRGRLLADLAVRLLT